MKVRILKKHWDKANKNRADYNSFNCLTDCLLGVVFKEVFPDKEITNATFAAANVDGKRLYSTDIENTTKLVNQWLSNDPAGRLSLPTTIEFKEI